MQVCCCCCAKATLARYQADTKEVRAAPRQRALSPVRPLVREPQLHASSVPARF